MRWHFVNQADHPLSIFDAPAVDLVDPQGNVYAEDPMGTAYLQSTAGGQDPLLTPQDNPGVTLPNTRVFLLSEKLFAKPGWYLRVSQGGWTYVYHLRAIR